MKKKKCKGSNKKDLVITRDEDPNINPGIVNHICPECGRRWARNTMQDWSHLPIPNHMKGLKR